VAVVKAEWAKKIADQVECQWWEAINEQNRSLYLRSPYRRKWTMLEGYKTKVAAVGFVILGAFQGAAEIGIFELPSLVFVVGIPLLGALGLYGLRDKLERIKPEA
jgi:hypothetical protein